MFPDPQRLSSDPLLDELQAAKLLNLSTRTLQAWRVSGAGPPFVRAGRAIRYRHSDLLSWISANTVTPPRATPDDRPAPDTEVDNDWL